MGNMDGRIEQDKGQSPAASGDAKDGPTGTATKKAPTIEGGGKASDVVHSGDRKPDDAAKSGP